MHSFISCLVHCVWSTKNHAPVLNSNLRERLWPYLGGIAREKGMKALAVGGVVDHVHILISLPATLSVAGAIQLLKGNSSRWIHETFPNQALFGWQEGYGAIQHRHFRSRSDDEIHSQPSGASPKTDVSRRASDDAAQAWSEVRRANA
jgi:REP element-mobilizing transposase RayT